MYAEIKSAIDSVKVISDVLKASKDLRNYNELASAISEVNAKLMDATTAALAGNEKISSLQERIRLLEQEIMEFKNWEAKVKDYTLKEVGTGIFAYIYTPAVESSKPKHWACVKCFEDCKISILQVSNRSSYLCFNCGSTIQPYQDGQLVSIEDVYHETNPPYKP